MHELFDELLAKGEQLLRGFEEQKKQETLELEFKRKEFASNGMVSKADRRNLGIALSGFSNSMGGLLVWGVAAVPDDDGVDCVTGLDPISELSKFESQIWSLTGELIVPKNETIRVGAVPSHDRDTGYLLVSIGRSERRPHMSLAPGHQRYYKRAGTSFYPMEHFDVEDAFKREAVAVLEICWEAKVTGQGANSRQARFRVGLKNSSEVTARFPFFHVQSVSGARISQWGIDGNRNTGLPKKITGDQTILYAGGVTDMLYPSQELSVFGLDIKVRLPVGENTPSPITVNYKIGCEGSRTIAGTMSISEQETLRILSNT